MSQKFQNTFIIGNQLFKENDLGLATNEFKRQLEKHRKTGDIETLLKRMSYGFPAILAAVEMQTKEINKEIDNIDNKRFRFLQSSLFALKIEDLNALIDPQRVIEKLEKEVAGVLFTEKHLLGIQHDYFIFFQLSKALTSPQDLRDLARLFKNRLIDLFPEWPSKTIRDLSPTIVVGGGEKAEAINPSNFVDVNKYISSIHETRKLRDQNKLAWLNVIGKKANYVPDFNELKAISKFIGPISEKEDWRKVITSIKNHEQLGEDLTTKQGLQLFRLLSDKTEPDSTYLRWNANGYSTIGTLLEFAQQKGYIIKEFPKLHCKSKVTQLPTEQIKVKNFLREEDIGHLLKSGDRIIIDSPTGSGKTTALLEACKKSAENQQHFFLFAVPTRPLVDQLTEKHQVFGIQGGVNNTSKKLEENIRNGHRCFISTFDKAEETIRHIKNIAGPHITFTLLVDEVHHMVWDYSFRNKAIQSLNNLISVAHTVIAMSGTTDDILSTTFTRKIDIITGNQQSPCQKFEIYEFGESTTANKQLEMLQELIKEKKQSNRKLLVFIQNKKHAKTISAWLNNNEVKADYLDGESKQRQLYKDLMKTGRFPDYLDVLVSTSVLADGLSIQNDFYYECLIVCSSISSFWNPSAIKQITNRFRNSYDCFSLFMQKNVEKDIRPFNIDASFQLKMKRANQIVNRLEREFVNDYIYYDPAFIEQKYGISSNNEGNWSIDQLWLRHLASREKEYYFAKYRAAFVAEVERLVGVQLTEKKAIGSGQAVVNFAEKKTYLPIEEVFTKEVFQAYCNGYSPEVTIFEQQIAIWHQRATRFLVDVASFQACQILLPKVTQHATQAQLVYRLKNLNNLLIMKQLKHKDKTMQICTALSEIKDALSSSEWKTEYNRIASYLLISANDVKDVAREYFLPKTSRKKVNGQSIRIKQIELLSIENVATEYNLPIKELKNILINLSKKMKPTRRKLLLQSIGQHK